MITVQKILFLRHVPLFAQLTAPEIARIAAIAEEVIYHRGERILAEGEFGDCLYVIVDGEVRIHHGEAQLNLLRQNDYMGEMSIFDGEPRSASASAVSDCLLLRINRGDFQEILAGNWSAALAIIRTLSQRVRKKEAELQAARSGRRVEAPPAQ